MLCIEVNSYIVVFMYMYMCYCQNEVTTTYRLRYAFSLHDRNKMCVIKLHPIKIAVFGIASNFFR